MNTAWAGVYNGCFDLASLLSDIGVVYDGLAGAQSVFFL